MIAFGVSFFSIVAAMRTFDGVVVVVVLAHLWFLCVGARADVTTAKIESQTGWGKFPEVFGAS